MSQPNNGSSSSSAGPPPAQAGRSSASRSSIPDFPMPPNSTGYNSEPEELAKYRRHSPKGKGKSKQVVPPSPPTTPGNDSASALTVEEETTGGKDKGKGKAREPTSTLELTAYWLHKLDRATTPKETMRARKALVMLGVDDYDSDDEVGSQVPSSSSGDGEGEGGNTGLGPEYPYGTLEIDRYSSPALGVSYIDENHEGGPSGKQGAFTPYLSSPHEHSITSNPTSPTTFGPIPTSDTLDEHPLTFAEIFTTNTGATSSAAPLPAHSPLTDPPLYSTEPPPPYTRFDTAETPVMVRGYRRPVTPDARHAHPCHWLAYDDDDEREVLFQRRAMPAQARDRDMEMADLQAIMQFAMPAGARVQHYGAPQNGDVSRGSRAVHGRPRASAATAAAAGRNRHAQVVDGQLTVQNGAAQTTSYDINYQRSYHGTVDVGASGTSRVGRNTRVLSDATVNYNDQGGEGSSRQHGRLSKIGSKIFQKVKEGVKMDDEARARRKEEKNAEKEEKKMKKLKAWEEKYGRHDKDEGGQPCGGY